MQARPLLRASQPPPQAPGHGPSLPDTPFPSALGVFPHSPHTICGYFRLPGTAHCQLPRVEMQLSRPQEPFLIHSPEATAQRGQAGRARNTPTWPGPLRLITPWGDRNRLQLCSQEKGGHLRRGGRGEPALPWDLAS